MVDVMRYGRCDNHRDMSKLTLFTVKQTNKQTEVSFYLINFSNYLGKINLEV